MPDTMNQTSNISENKYFHELIEANKQRDKAVKALSACETKLSHVEEDFAFYKNKYNRKKTLELNAKIQDLNAMLTSKDQEIERWQKETEKAEAAAAEAEAQKFAAELQLEQEREERKKSEYEVKKVTDELDQVKAQLQLKDEEIASLQAMIDTMQCSMDLLKDDKDAGQIVVDALKESIRSLAGEQYGRSSEVVDSERREEIEARLSSQNNDDTQCLDSTQLSASETANAEQSEQTEDGAEPEDAAEPMEDSSEVRLSDSTSQSSSDHTDNGGSDTIQNDCTSDTDETSDKKKADNDSEASDKKGGKKTRKKKPTLLELLNMLGIEPTVIIHDLEDYEKFCPNCGEPLTCIGKKFAGYTIDLKGLPIEVFEHFLLSYTCKSCDAADKVTASADEVIDSLMEMTDSEDPADAIDALSLLGTICSNDMENAGELEDLDDLFDFSDSMEPSSVEESDSEISADGMDDVADMANVAEPDSAVSTTCADQDTSAGEPSENTSGQVSMDEIKDSDAANASESEDRKSKGEKGKKSRESEKIYQPKPPSRLLNASWCSVNFMAMIFLMKIQFQIPLNRIVDIFSTFDLFCFSKSTLCTWFIKVAEIYFRPLYNLLKDFLILCDVVQADESTLQVINEAASRKKKTSFMWQYRSTADAPRKIILFEYTPGRQGEYAARFLQGFVGKLLVDGYSGYNKVIAVTIARCWVHARRYFIQALQYAGDQQMIQLAYDGLLYIQKIFEIEADIAERELSKEQKYQERRKKSLPVVRKLFKWADSIDLDSLNSEKLRKAIKYLKKYQKDLEVFLTDPNVPVHNNACEQVFISFARGRHNWGFCYSPEGAHALEVMFSIVKTAMANQLNVFKYLVYVMKTLMPYRDGDELHAPKSVLESLLPWSDEVIRNCGKILDVPEPHHHKVPEADELKEEAEARMTETPAVQIHDATCPPVIQA